MGNRESVMQQKLAEFLFVIKLLALFFSVVAYLQYFYQWISSESINYAALLLSLVAIFGIMALMYLSFWYAYKQHLKTDKRISTVIKATEYLIITIVFITSIMVSGSYNSPYKILFIFLIVSTTLEFGMKTGIASAAFSSLILFFIDLLFSPQAVVNNFFENDILLAGVFVVTAWAVGFYSKTQDEFITDLKRMINIDGLTGLYDHRYFHEQLHEYFDKAKKEDLPLSLLLMDVDNFKLYNEILGYQQGDEALKQMAQLIKDCAGEKALSARYAGQQFGVILPRTDAVTARELAETIRGAVEAHPFYGQEHLPGETMTISVAVAAIQPRHNAYTDLLQDGGDALLRAKMLRRNSVESYISIFEQLQSLDENEEFEKTISSIKTLIAVIDSRDQYTYGHVERVVTYAQILADKLALSKTDRRTLIYGAYIHDVGKINISRETLMKTGPLTAEEWNELKTHPTKGAEIVGNVDYLKDVIPLILYHHERYDGKGYPSGLKETEIAPLARALTVCDSFDAMTSRRPYQRTRAFEDAIEEIRRCEGTQFDPYYAEIFLEAIQEYRKTGHVVPRFPAAKQS